MEGQKNQIELEAEFVKLLENNLDPRKYFTKKKYESYFKQYCETHRNAMQQISAAFQQLKSQNQEEKDCNEDQRQLLLGIAKAAASYVKAEVDQCRGFSKGNRQAELNLFMVTSVFPCILELGDSYGPILCDELVEQWKQTFAGVSLGYQTFEQLNSSFRSVFGFLTGR